MLPGYDRRELGLVLGLGLGLTTHPIIKHPLNHLDKLMNISEVQKEVLPLYSMIIVNNLYVIANIEYSRNELGSSYSR